jgi:hypothetical protein
MDINTYCAHKAMELRTSTLSYVPRGERERYIEALMGDYRREARLADVTNAPLPRHQRLPPQRLHEGMKTSLSTTPNPCFSTPTSYGASNSTLLQKQRKAERAAMKKIDERLAGSAKAGRKLPW